MIFSRGRGRPGGPPLRVVPAEPIAEPERRTLVRSKIYEVDPSRGWGGGGPEGDPAAPQDRLVALLRDRKFHEASEVVGAGIGVPELCAAVSELISLGHAFDRCRGLMRMRMRAPGEARQSVADLVQGLEVAPVGTAGDEVPLTTAAGPPEGFDPTTDAAGADLAGGGLVLSDPPAALTLPSDGSCGRTSFVFAQRGAGKTYLGGVMVEEMVSLPDRYSVAVVDPCGVWWGLLSSSEGTPSRYGFLLLGGQRGIRPLRARDGARAADVVAAVRPRPVVLDLSGLAPVEQHDFVADFCARLMVLPHFPVHVVIDEADEFCPQRLREPGQKRVLAQVERMVMRGRASGKGATLISLRPAVVSKNVLSQVDSLYLLRLVETNDLRAVGEWLDNFERGITPEQRASCMSQLPILPSGTAYFLRGGDEVMFRRFRVRRKHTHDSSKTESGGTRVDPLLAVPDREVLAAVDRAWAASVEAPR